MDGVAVPTRIQESIRPAMAVAAAWCVGGWAANCAANPTGRGGGTATKAGAIPAPSVAAKLANADSMAGAAADVANAAANVVLSVLAAPAIETEGGTIVSA
jgi:hypothetical protein